LSEREALVKFACVLFAPRKRTLWYAAKWAGLTPTAPLLIFGIAAAGFHRGTRLSDGQTGTAQSGKSS
jgi:hypothetical protein